MYLEHFDFQVHPITFENLANSTAVDMTVHKSKKSVFSSPGSITVFVMTLMATSSS